MEINIAIKTKLESVVFCLSRLLFSMLTHVMPVVFFYLELTHLFVHELLDLYTWCTLSCSYQKTYSLIVQFILNTKKKSTVFHSFIKIGRHQWVTFSMLFYSLNNKIQRCFCRFSSCLTFSFGLHQSKFYFKDDAVLMLLAVRYLTTIWHQTFIIHFLSKGVALATYI